MAALIAISLAVAMANLDTAITNTALPTIATSIGADPSSVIWVVNAYQLAMIATLLRSRPWERLPGTGVSTSPGLPCLR